MKIVPDKRLFWFLKEDVELDLDSPVTLDMYIQQIFTYGLSQDIKVIFEKIEFTKLKESFGRIKLYLSQEIRKFWEDYFADT